MSRKDAYYSQRGKENSGINFDGTHFIKKYEKIAKATKYPSKKVIQEE
jgi:hypothetical protein